LTPPKVVSSFHLIVWRDDLEPQQQKWVGFSAAPWTHAGIAQLVEHNLAKVGVAGSSPVSRSWGASRSVTVLRSLSRGAVAKW
jgi:hypothetical protein